MAGEITRRHWLKGMAAAFAATGCDQLDVDVVPQPGGFATSDGIRPVTPNEGFYVYQYGSPPTNDPDQWVCTINGLSGLLGQLDNALLASLTPIEIEYTLQCIGGNPRNTLISNAVWGGLPFEEVLASLGITWPASTLELVFRATDNYHTSVPISDLVDGRLWLVWEMNGEPLSFEHGAPARFLCLGRYGTKNVKWPSVLQFVDEPYVGFWEEGGWSADATYQVNGFIFNPLEGTSQSGDVQVFGTAHGGADPITRVEITYDDGASWEDVELTYNPGPNRWTLWRTTLVGASGLVQARIRVTSASGVQTQGHEITDQAMGYDGGMRVSFTVNA